jgi:hypothetical protein
MTQTELETLKRDRPTKESALATLREARAIVGQKSPGDVQAFRDLVLSVAQHSAEAAKEGGFLGFGGVQVSKEEQQALDEIKAALT